MISGSAISELPISSLHLVGVAPGSQTNIIGFEDRTCEIAAVLSHRMIEDRTDEIEEEPAVPLAEEDRTEEVE